MGRRKDGDRVWVLRRRRGPRRVERYPGGIAALAALAGNADAELIVAIEGLEDISWRGFFAQAARSQPLALRVLAGSGKDIGDDADAIDSRIAAPVTGKALAELDDLAVRTRPLRERLSRRSRELDHLAHALDASLSTGRSLFDMLSATVETTSDVLERTLTAAPEAGDGDSIRLLRIWRRWLGIVDLKEGRISPEKGPVALTELVDAAATSCGIAVDNAVSPKIEFACDRVLAVRTLVLLVAAASDLCRVRPLRVLGGADEARLLLPGATQGAAAIEAALAGTHGERPAPFWVIELALARRLGAHAGLGVEPQGNRTGRIELRIGVLPA